MMMMMAPRGGLFFGLLWCSLSSYVVLAEAEGRAVEDYGLIEWLRAQEGGYFNPKQQVRDVDASENKQLGIFATERIEEGEVLFKIPWDMMITDAKEGEDDEDAELKDLNCQLVENLIKEMKLGKEGVSSKFGPYVQYLLDLPTSQLPCVYSDIGQALLLEILGGEDQEIPPGSMFDYIEIDWHRGCKVDPNDNFATNAAALVMQRSMGDNLMVPIYDWYTHRNGKYFNTKNEIVLGEYFHVLARRTIEAGEQIHNSYDLCDECDESAVEQGYGTPEILRDYGFVEQLPQRYTFQPNAIEVMDEDGSWIYAPEQISFELREAEDGQNLEVKWAEHLTFDNRGRNYVRQLFRKALKRLYRFQNIMYPLDQVEIDWDMPQQEWDTIRAYYYAIQTAFKYAIYSLVNDEDDSNISDRWKACSEGMSSNVGVCPSANIDVYGIHYDDLGEEEDDLNYIEPTCKHTQLVEFYNYRDLEQYQTNYQQLGFLLREEDQNTCMNIENTLQICSHYRPHYHEFFVHFPARYIPEIKRVIFIGGGDAMLLHEALKYPNIEKVVGLELDQQVTRKSFKYFKSQPHYDDDRVEWWYGDATKSLPLLPKDYWGSFDLVLVDLSETVMSMSVTGELDIFSALSLLLKPEGIMVKNEPYIDQFSEFFDHTIHIFYGCPKICTQVLVMGSNKVDFLHDPVKDHDVEKLLVAPLEKETDRFKYFHDYRKTDARAQGKCGDWDIDNDAISTAHGRKAGIIEIVEAENSSVPLDVASLEEKIYSAIRKEGLTPVSTPANDDGVVVVVMEEGYVVARLYPEDNYCGLDINLWGGFQKMTSLRAALASTVGSTSLSSFRVVVGGMHGSSTWEEDKEVIGIQVSQTRNCEIEIEESSDKEETLIRAATKVAIENAVELVAAKDSIVAVVVCGLDECSSAQVVEDHERVGVMVNIPPCSGLQIEEDDIMYFPNMYECEKDIIGKLDQLFGEAAEEDMDIDLFVVDSNAPFQMVQILDSIWSFYPHRENWLADRHLFVSPLSIPKEEAWRRNFLERYRKKDQSLTVTRAELILKSGRTSVELGLLSTGDRYFFHNLRAVEGKLRDALSDVGKFTVEVKSITGGLKYDDREFDERVFEPEAYDATPALEQASKQKSLGRQSIFQLEFSDDGDSTMPTFEELGDFLKDTLAKTQYTPLRFEKFSKVGDGAVVVSIFKEGGVVLVWDGRHHVDINLFSSNDDKENADAFLETFMDLSNLQISLRDDQPRGTGRVVQFKADMS